MNTDREFCIVFDNQCFMCSRFIRLVDQSLAREKQVFVTSAPLNSDILAFNSSLDLRACEILSRTSILVILPNSPVLTKSKAVLFIAKNCEGAWAAATAFILHILPCFASNFFYDLVAYYRNLLKPKAPNCSLSFERIKLL